MFLVELIASSFLDLISKQLRPECRCKGFLVHIAKVQLHSPAGKGKAARERERELPLSVFGGGGAHSSHCGILIFQTTQEV